MKLFSRIRKFLKWPLSFKLLLIEALWTSVISEVYLKLNGFEKIKSLHVNNEIKDPPNQEHIQAMARVSKAMRLIEKFAPWRPRCYNRALTAKRMLAKRNIETSLHIGFRKKDDKFDGHAWLTHQGQIVTGFLPGISNFNKLEGQDFLQNHFG